MDTPEPLKEYNHAEAPHIYASVYTKSNRQAGPVSQNQVCR